MGCGSTREHESEEILIRNAEYSLRFYSIKAETLDVTFRKYNHHGTINQSQLIQISQQLGFRILNTKENPNIMKFYQSLKENGNYPLKDLLLISILLGKGSPVIKARLIYEVFDEHFTHQLSIDLIKTQMLEKMFKLCLNFLPLLVVDSDLSLEEQVRYRRKLGKLNDFIAVACEKLAEGFCIRGQVISVETFVEVFCEHPQLLTPSGLRKYLAESRLTCKNTLSSNEEAV